MEAEKGHERFFQNLSRFLPKAVELPEAVEVSSKSLSSFQKL